MTLPFPRPPCGSPGLRRRALVALLGAVVLAPAAPPALAGQSEGTPRPLHAAPFETFAGGEWEIYLRTLQNAGEVVAYPWSLRGFSPGEAEALLPADSLHPWGERIAARGGRDASGLQAGLVRPRIRLAHNTAFPFGGNDGPTWAGRGLTTTVRVGAWARWGPVSLVVAPVAFRAENRSFELAPNGQGESARFRSPLTPNNVDLPQAFGEGPYARLDAGNSTLRLDLAGTVLGISTAAQQWGPSQVHPLVLGPNAGGFAHVFVGTSRPVGVGLGRIHGRVVWGRLQPSELTPRNELDPRHLMTGLVVAFEPRGLPGLELGLTRFAHIEWPDDLSWSDLRQPFATVIGSRATDEERDHPDNELASVFARWNVPGAGFEIFGEWVRVDGSYDTRTFLIEPDDLSGYALGIRRVWTGEERLTVLRGEVFSTVSSHRLRDGARLQYANRARPMYQHGRLIQGHTHRGQLLASPAGHGGQGSTVALDRYDPGGRWTFEFERRLERDRTVGSVPPAAPDADVTYVLGAERVRFGERVQLDLGVRAVYNLNRYLRDDRFNLNLRLGMTAAF